MIVPIKNTSPHDIPAYATLDSAGVDIRAHISEDISLGAMERTLIPTGIYLAIPKGHEIQIRPRSGLAYKKGLTVLNAPGTIDADYRGEIKVLLVNLSSQPATISPGERIAQMVLAAYSKIEWQQTEDLQDTLRGEGGFGSTGKQ